MKSIAIPENKNLEKIDKMVVEYLTTEISTPLKKAIVMGLAIKEINNLLTNDVFEPILGLQGSRLGFLTDKQYGTDIVKRCFIESLLRGLQPVGNQWNIIAGNLYCTKEGYTYLLSQMEGLKYQITPSIPVNANGGAKVKEKIEWEYRSNKGCQEIEFACKGYGKEGSDYFLGKAERKAKHWLYWMLTGIDLTDGDVGDYIDTQATEVKPDTKDNPFINDVVAETENDKDSDEEKIKDDFELLIKSVGGTRAGVYLLAKYNKSLDDTRKSPDAMMSVLAEDDFVENANRYCNTGKLS